jgi:hypothetical protein
MMISPGHASVRRPERLTRPLLPVWFDTLRLVFRELRGYFSLTLGVDQQEAVLPVICPLSLIALAETVSVFSNSIPSDCV